MGFSGASILELGWGGFNVIDVILVCSVLGCPGEIVASSRLARLGEVATPPRSESPACPLVCSVLL